MGISPPHPTAAPRSVMTDTDTRQPRGPPTRNPIHPTATPYASKVPAGRDEDAPKDGERAGAPARGGQGARGPCRRRRRRGRCSGPRGPRPTKPSFGKGQAPLPHRGAGAPPKAPPTGGQYPNPPYRPPKRETPSPICVVQTRCAGPTLVGAGLSPLAQGSSSDESSPTGGEPRDRAGWYRRGPPPGRRGGGDPPASAPSSREERG